MHPVFLMATMLVLNFDLFDACMNASLFARLVLRSDRPCRGHFSHLAAHFRTGGVSWTMEGSTLWCCHKSYASYIALSWLCVAVHAQGHSAMLLRIFPYAAINYMAFEQFKRVKECPTPFRTCTFNSHLRSVQLLCMPLVVGTGPDSARSARVPACSSLCGLPRR